MDSRSPKSPEFHYTRGRNAGIMAVTIINGVAKVYPKACPYAQGSQAYVDWRAGYTDGVREASNV